MIIVETCLLGGNHEDKNDCQSKMFNLVWIINFLFSVNLYAATHRFIFNYDFNFEDMIMLHLFLIIIFCWVVACVVHNIILRIM